MISVRPLLQTHMCICLCIIEGRIFTKTKKNKSRKLICIANELKLVYVGAASSFRTSENNIKKEILKIWVSP